MMRNKKPKGNTILVGSECHSWNECLNEANFVPYYPNDLPNGLTITRIVFRPEHSSTDYPRCSLKIYIEDKSRKLSIKQFNYDWSPPAYDCPCLWKNHINFPNVDVPEPVPHLIENSLVWIGFNYRNEKAASVTRGRTLIEFSVSEGKFSDLEFIQLSKGFISLNKDHLKKINSKTFAELSYGYPQAIKTVNVPISFWKVPHESSEIQFQRAFTPQKAPLELKSHLNLSKNSHYLLNSIFTYTKQQELSILDSRVEFLYEHSQIPGATLRILRSRRTAKLLTYPPEPDNTQKFRFETVNILNKIIYLAYRSIKYGPYEACWQDNEYNYLLLFKPIACSTKEWFLEFLRMILSLKP